MFKEVLYKSNEKFNANVTSTLNSIHSNAQVAISTENNECNKFWREGGEYN